VLEPFERSEKDLRSKDLRSKGSRVVLALERSEKDYGIALEWTRGIRGGNWWRLFL
jgi:hypothetical protein